MIAKIINTSDGKHINEVVDTDLLTINILKIKISGRMHKGDGVWRLWNNDYIIDIEEIKIDGENN